jgi:hypothetical protein
MATPIESLLIHASVAAESDRNVAYGAALQGVAKAARTLREADPDLIAYDHAVIALWAALDVVDSLEKRT